MEKYCLCYSVEIIPLLILVLKLILSKCASRNSLNEHKVINCVVIVFELLINIQI
jgi:hypothetical protein